MKTRVRKYTLGELFGTTFQLIGELWQPLLSIAIVLFCCNALFLVMQKMFLPAFWKILGNVTTDTMTPHEVLGSLSGPCIAYILWEFIGGICTFIVAALGWHYIHENNPSVQDAITTVKQSLGHLILQWLIIFGLLILMTGILILGMSGLLILMQQKPTIGGILLCVFIIACVACLVWFFVSIVFGGYSVTLERRHAWEGIRRSISLVRGRWWRICGYIVLFNIIVAFINLLLSNLIQSPINLNILSQFILSQNKGDPQREMLFQLQTVYQNPWTWVLLFLSMDIQVIINWIATPLFIILLFIDTLCHKEPIELEPESTQPIESESAESLMQHESEVPPGDDNV